jgi:hypothetical protein
MFEDFDDGKVFSGTDNFQLIQVATQARVAEIRQDRGSNLRSRLRTHIALSMLNARLSYFGWAVRWDGSLFEVPVRGQTPERSRDSDILHGSVEDINQRARKAYITTGKIIDPQSGRVLTRSEGKRCGS